MTNNKADQPFPARLSTALGIFTLLGGLLVVLLPRIDLTGPLGWVNSDPRRLLLGVTAYGLLVLTALLLWLARRMLRLPLSWFFYALLFNGLIVLVKFVASPNNYQKLSTTALSLTAVAVSLLYFAGIAVVYAFAQGKFKNVAKGVSPTTDVKLLFTAGLFVAINFARLVIFAVPPLSHTPAAEYLRSIFQGGGLLLSSAIFLIIFAAVEAFDRARHDKVLLRQVGLLSVAMLVIYHVLWVLFIQGLGGCGC